MKTLIENLRGRTLGSGQWEVWTETEDFERIETTTNNMLAVDCAFDDCYDDEDNSERIYESSLEAKTVLVDEILRANNLD